MSEMSFQELCAIIFCKTTKIGRMPDTPALFDRPQAVNGLTSSISSEMWDSKLSSGGIKQENYKFFSLIIKFHNTIIPCVGEMYS